MVQSIMHSTPRDLNSFAANPGAVPGPSEWLRPLQRHETAVAIQFVDEANGL
jgi:hypothetical protein